ncbi:MAG: ATP-binding protein, partial [Bacteroidota bacterium]
YIFEAEPVTKTSIEVIELFNQTRHFVSYMEQSHSLKHLADKIANETRAITGYDRVMIYRFDKNYNGEVFAESKREDLEPFLGLHYPHTDIPSQARALYLKNLVRMISDINYTPVPLLTINNADHSSLDLSLSVLRSTSPIHVQYLGNMGVGATLTISLIHENKLWGLIACHHYSPKYISPDVRLSAQLQGHFLTSQIDVRQSAEEYDSAREINNAIEKLLDEKFELNSDSLLHIVSHHSIMKVCNASGVAIMLNGRLFKNGITPANNNELHQLFNWCETYSGPKEHFSTSKLAAIYKDADSLCNTAAGIIYHSMGNNLNTAIMWFRPETIYEIAWAGDPAKAIVKDENGLHPRKSFQLWKEVIKCQSREWIKPELNGAATYAHALQKHIHLLRLTEEEARYKKLNDLLTETNAELENINWISTHDLQEPLRKIQIMASRIIEYDDQKIPDEITRSVQRMNASASRMQNLLKDILSYGRIRHDDNKTEPVDLNELVAHMLLEMHEETADKQATLTHFNLPAVRGTPFLLNQLFVNLVRNSIKFAKAGTPPNIVISGNGPERKFDQVYHKITVEDNGIGFEDEFSESIFKLFTRLHGIAEYTGSGVGLALCKKIMQSHNGYITAAGKPNEGAKFYLYFPVTE